MAIDNNKETNRRQLRKDIQLGSWRDDIIRTTGGSPDSLDAFQVGLSDVGSLLSFVNTDTSSLESWRLYSSTSPAVPGQVVIANSLDNLRWFNVTNEGGSGRGLGETLVFATGFTVDSTHMGKILDPATAVALNLTYPIPEDMKGKTFALDASAGAISLTGYHLRSQAGAVIDKVLPSDGLVVVEVTSAEYRIVSLAPNVSGVSGRSGRPIVLNQDFSKISDATLTTVPIPSGLHPDGLSTMGFQLRANEIIWVTMLFRVEDAGNPRNQKYSMVGPAGCSVIHYLDATGDGTPSQYVYGNTVSVPNLHGSGSSNSTVRITAYITNGPTAGFINLRFAQNTSSATPITLKKGSIMMINGPGII